MVKGGAGKFFSHWGKKVHTNCVDPSRLKNLLDSNILNYSNPNWLKIKFLRLSWAKVLMKNITKHNSLRQYFHSLCEPASASVEWASCNTPCRIKQAAPTLKLALQTAAGSLEPHPSASLHTKIQPPSSGVVRVKQKAKKGVKKVNIYEQIRWTMRCQFNIKKDQI